jgi:hypothetical protein
MIQNVCGLLSSSTFKIYIYISPPHGNFYKYMSCAFKNVYFVSRYSTFLAIKERVAFTYRRNPRMCIRVWVCVNFLHKQHLSNKYFDIFQPTQPTSGHKLFYFWCTKLCTILQTYFLKYIILINFQTYVKFQIKIKRFAHVWKRFWTCIQKFVCENVFISVYTLKLRVHY